MKRTGVMTNSIQLTTNEPATRRVILFVCEKLSSQARAFDV